MKLDETEMEFDMVGVDAAIANAFRRILIAEVKYSYKDSYTLGNGVFNFPEQFPYRFVCKFVSLFD